jgi:hypothetical protein
MATYSVYPITGQTSVFLYELPNRHMVVILWLWTNESI